MCECDERNGLNSHCVKKIQNIFSFLLGEQNQIDHSRLN